MTGAPVPVLLGASAVAASLPVLWWALAADRGSSKLARQRLNKTADLREAVLTRSAGERAVRPLAAAAARQVRRWTPAGRLDRLEQRITLAGRPREWPLERVLAAKLLLGAGGLLFGFLYASSGPSVGRLFVGLGSVTLAFFAPDLLLHSRGQERRAAIKLALPDTLDQMTICVEAGLGFESAMAQAAQNGDGPLAEEFLRTLQEMQVGVTRGQAFRNLAARTDVPDLRHFVHAVIQAEAYGVPVADVLRTQAEEQRVKRRQTAEERAMKIPVKVVFPLVFCILPTLFIVILGPAVIQVARTLFGGNGPFN